jgi:hypothetical protein
MTLCKPKFFGGGRGGAEADSSFVYQAQLNREKILSPKRGFGDFLLLF